MNTERRFSRSDVRHRALSLFLDGARARQHANAVALTTREGLLVAGAGATTADLEQLGALGAANRSHWNAAKLHVREVLVNDEPLALTCAGSTPLSGTEIDEGIRRILG
jgi:hypothetical protein